MQRQRATVIPTEGIGLVEGGREQRIAPGLHVFVDGFISEARCADALDQQLRHRAIYQALIAPVVEAAGESPGEPQTGIALAHQQLACVAGVRAAGKICTAFAHAGLATGALRADGLWQAGCQSLLSFDFSFH